MDLLAQYSGSDAGDSSGPERPDTPVDPKDRLSLSLAITTAPQVSTAGLTLVDNQATSLAAARMLQDPKARKVYYNVPYEDLHAPVLGPSHPYQRDGVAAGLKNHRAGHVEDAHMNDFVFEEQYNTFQSYGYADAPNGSGVVGSGVAHHEQNGATTFSAPKRRKTTQEKREEAKVKAEREAAAAQLDPDVPFTLNAKLPWAEKEAGVVELTVEQKDFMAQIEAGKLEDAAKGVETQGPTSFFHGKEDKDYQGRSWLEGPKDKRKDNEQCFLPKRWLHTWSGHSKGVNAIRFFPDTGHLLLSAGLDGKVKIWDVHGSGKCMRTYLGHSKGVRDIKFSSDGRRFLSTGYDRVVRYWDTETGQVLRTINNGKVFYCLQLHPDPAKQNVLMAGCSDKKIYQWDLETGDCVQEYNYHLGAVNSVTFVDEGRRFVSTSDDKTIRVWEFGIPVQIKYIADPSMHSIPSVSLSPNNTYLLGQSLDNQILAFSTKDRFRQNRKKTFKGHNTAGYACQVNWSPDGRFVMSGDAEGRAFFWEWQHPYKIVRTMKAHDQVCIGVAWNPVETSKVATCSWDGLIKYWD